MTAHDLKTWPAPFRSVLSGKKLAEVRRDDRGFMPGDILNLREWDPVTKEYSGRVVTVRVTHITRGRGLPVDLVVMSFAVAERPLYEWQRAARPAEVTREVAASVAISTAEMWYAHDQLESSYIAMLDGQCSGIDATAEIRLATAAHAEAAAEWLRTRSTDTMHITTSISGCVVTATAVAR